MSREPFDEHSDEKLMRLFIETKKAAFFTAIYQRHFVPLCKYLNWLINDMERAKDIGQNIFVKIHDRPILFETNKNFKVWLFSIAKNQWKNDMRSQSNQRKQLEKMSWPAENDDDRHIDNKKQKAKLKKAMQALSENHREVVVLKYSSNLSIHEIAETLDCSQGTVKSRLFYALKSLKDLTKNQRNE